MYFRAAVAQLDRAVASEATGQAFESPQPHHSRKSTNPKMPTAKLFTPREAAQVLGISYPTLKQWIYKKQIRTVKTAGGHHRIPEKEIDRYLYRATEQGDVADRRTNFRRISGRNQLVGRVTDIKMDGLIAQVAISIGGQRITSIITADAVRELRLKKGQTVAALVKSTEVMIVRI
jgi:molybdopterin-binding protein